jgi:heptosyltransferase-2
MMPANSDRLRREEQDMHSHDRMSSRRGEITKILALCLPGIGDTILFTPALRALRQHFPRAQIWVLVMFPGSQQVLEKNPHVDHVILWEFLKEGAFRSLKFLLGLRRQRFDVSIMAYPANRIEYSVVHFLIGARNRYGHRYHHRNLRSLNVLHGHTILEDNGRHNVEENMALLRLLGIEVQDPFALELYLSKEDQAWARRWLRERGLEGELLIGFHAGTAEFKNQARRRWAREKFAQLGDILSEELGARMLLFGGPDEEQLNEDIRSRMSHPGLLVSSTTMRQTAALIEHCDLFVSNDSALMHTAAAMKVPCVVIFGPTNPQWVHPYGTPHGIVRLNLDCSPCFYYSARPLTCRRGDFICITDLEVQRVATAVRELLLRETS